MYLALEFFYDFRNLVVVIKKIYTTFHAAYY